MMVSPCVLSSAVLLTSLSLLHSSTAFMALQPPTRGTATAIVSPSAVTQSTKYASDAASSWRSSSTCLHAEESENDPSAEKEEAPVAKKETKDSTTDILNSPAFLKRKLEVLKSDRAKTQEDLEKAKELLAAGKAEWGAQLDDLQKEYQNIQTRLNSQSNKGDDMANLQVARKMLDVLDTFDRAFGVVTSETDEQLAIEAEYKGTYTMILDTLKGLGVEEVETVGKEFDYEVHQAIMQRPSEGYEEGIVCEEFQKGFKMGDTLVRAAMVAVAA